MNRRSQFYNSSSLRGPATNKLGEKVKNTKISTNKTRYILRRIFFFVRSLSLMVTNLLKTLLSYKI